MLLLTIVAGWYDHFFALTWVKDHGCQGNVKIEFTAIQQTSILQINISYFLLYLCQISDQATQKGLQNILKHHKFYPILLFQNSHGQQITSIKCMIYQTATLSSEATILIFQFLLRWSYKKMADYIYQEGFSSILRPGWISPLKYLSFGV